MTNEETMLTDVERFDELAQNLNQKALNEPFDDPEMFGVCRQAAAEGIVVLKNDGVLPLKKEEMVTYFGRNQWNYFYVGYGSGGDVVATHLTSPAAYLTERTDITVNRDLMERYKIWCDANVPDEGAWGTWPTHFEEMPLSEEEISEEAAKGKTAVLFIGRAAGESLDNRPEEGCYYLTQDEKDMIRKVTNAYAKTVIVLDAGNQLDLSWSEEYGDKISALVYAWQGGMESGPALIQVLYGEIMPSGHLTDTIARNYPDYPASGNFGREDYNFYEEDIYVGYRWFETFAKDKVLYPFGYGLTYTNFFMEAEAAMGEKTKAVTVKVTNTGSLPGAQVVQIYGSAPQGKLGKSEKVLVAFGKTKQLQPGEGETLTCTFSMDQMASYDDTGVTGNQSCYVLEAGEYRFYYGDNVRDARPLATVTLPELTVVQQLSEQCAPVTAFYRVKAVSEDGTLVPVKEAITQGTNKRKEDILAHMPEALTAEAAVGSTFEDVLNGKVSLESFVASLSPVELAALASGEGAMDSPFGTIGNAGMFGGTLESLREKKVPTIITTDGPSGVRVRLYSSLLPCGTALASSWNLELIHEMGRLFGKEIAERGSDVILAPGMNIHRDPMCGRNFEYYSEDPYLTGKVAAAMVSGVQTSGRSACPKHFACNNQEQMRNVCDSRLSERALREIYLKGFEICVKEAAPMTIMTSYNKVNGVWSHYNYELVTNILRKEWGYKGLVITDWWMQPCTDPDFPALTNNAYRVRGQIDVLMPGGNGFFDKAPDNTIMESYEKPEGITLGEMQRVAMNVLTLGMRLKKTYQD